MICKNIESCFYCEYIELFVTLIISTEKEEFILAGKYCKFYETYAIPKYNDLKENPFYSNVIKGEDAKSVIEFYIKRDDNNEVSLCK